MAGKKQAVGVIGLGIIGSRVAANLRRAGREVWVWNRSPKTEPNFLTSAAEVAETADIISLFVSDGRALIETMKALEPSLAARHLIINHATVSPDEAREAARLAAQQSAGFLDAPFTGSRDAAEAGQLVYFVSGSSEWIERAKPVLGASSRAVIEIGSEVGQASLVKLATNMIAASTVEVLAEALAVVGGGGVSAAKFMEVFMLHGTRSGLADMKLPGMIRGDFEAHFALKHMFKDLQLALEAGRAAGLSLPATAATAGAVMAGIQQGWADSDFSIVARHYDFPGKEPLTSMALPEEKGDDSKPETRRFSLFGGRRP